MASKKDQEKTLASLLKEQRLLETVRDALQRKVDALRTSGETRKADEARAKIKKITKKS